jgi:hypothetical protein
VIVNTVWTRFWNETVVAHLWTLSRHLLDDIGAKLEVRHSGQHFVQHFTKKSMKSSAVRCILYSGLLSASYLNYFI